MCNLRLNYSKIEVKINNRIIFAINKCVNILYVLLINLVLSIKICFILYSSTIIFKMFSFLLIAFKFTYWYYFTFCLLNPFFNCIVMFPFNFTV